MTRSEIRLTRRAIRNRWPLTAKLRKTLVAKLQGIVEKCAEPRAVIGAAKALIDADKLNMEQEKRDMQIPDRIDVTSKGERIERDSLTAADVAAARALLGVADRGVPADGGS